MSARLLLVEDDEAVRTVAQLSLQQLGGYQVLAVDSGPQALAQAAGWRPDLLLLDVAMPGMDGPQTLAALREQPGLHQVPAVFFTANTAPGQLARLRDLGAVDVIAKPFDPQQLCERMAAVLAQSTSAAAPTPAPASRQPVVLVVEDDPGIRFLLGFILQQQGWQVREAHDGWHGRAALEEGPAADLVLLDIMLPGIDGLALLEQLRATPAWDGVPVMMLTANGDEPSVRRALALGASDYLGKPFDPADLVSRLNRLAQPPRV